MFPSRSLPFFRGSLAFWLAVLAVPLVSPARTESSTLPAQDPFTEDSRWWSVTGGVSFDDRLGQIHVVQAGLGYGLAPDLEVHAGVTLGYAHALRTKDHLVGGPQVGAIWRLAHAGRWSGYLDGLAGAVVHEEPLTETSLRFNFDLQAGLGAGYALAGGTLVRGGIRWHHLSNARVRGKPRNLGYDGPLLYVGVVVPY
jgi:hypothetical protein